MVTIETIQSVNYVLAVFGILAILITIALVYDLKTKRLLSGVIQKFGILIAGIVAFFATIMTLIYSEVFGIIPCGFCWLERTMLYPQVILLGVAIYTKDRIMPKYGIALSSFGLLISLYHHYIQMGGSQFVKCPAAGAGADCAKRFIFEFGFITFPMLSAILFALLIVIYLYLCRVRPYGLNLAE